MKEKVIWNRKQLKKNALSTIKNNLWVLLFIGILMSTIFGEYTITKTSNESLDTINKYIVAIQEGKEVELIQNGENSGKELN